MSRESGEQDYAMERYFTPRNGVPALTLANAWLTLQGNEVQLQAVVGDDYSVTLYYRFAVPPAEEQWAEPKANPFTLVPETLKAPILISGPGTAPRPLSEAERALYGMPKENPA